MHRFHLLFALTAVLAVATCNAAQCPVGSFGEAANCLPCTPGRYSPVAGMPTCVECAPGSYTASYTSSSCLACEQGKFQHSAGATSCQACPVATIQPTSGSTHCHACPSGWWSPNATVECAPCPAGTILAAADTGLGRCVPCPIGTFSAERASTQCTTCPYNTFSGVQGATTCVSCRPSFFTDGVGSTHVDQCRYCTDAFNQTWPANPPGNPMVWITCAPYLCSSGNALARELCANWDLTTVSLIEQTCAATHSVNATYAQNIQIRAPTVVQYLVLFLCLVETLGMAIILTLYIVERPCCKSRRRVNREVRDHLQREIAREGPD